MIFLLDANVLIDANRDYYSMGRVPEFWEWLEYHGERGSVRIPIEIVEEISGGEDVLAKWLGQRHIKKALLLEDSCDVSLLQRVVYEGYAPDPTDIEIATIGRDPFLISYALRNVGRRTVVTTESSKPSAKRANRKVPDVCRQFGIPCCNSFEFIRTLDFRTNWKAD